MNLFARQQNSWGQRVKFSSRQDAKNAKESTILFQPINDASDPLLYERLAEIEQVLEPPSGRSQVCEELLLVPVVELIDTLEFDNGLDFDKEVGPKALVEFVTFVLDFPWRSWRLGESKKLTLIHVNPRL